nr:hypothetical protein [Tanacetum cinerariifolium]
MAIPEEEGDGYIKEVVRVEYEWKPPHCVDCKSFGHDTSVCPKRVREEVPKNSARDTKTTVMEENDYNFTEDPSFPVVQQYVSNAWMMFGFVRITRNDDGVYLFKFATRSGRDHVIEKGPWMIRKSPIILSKWSPSESLKRGEVTKVLVDEKEMKDGGSLGADGSAKVIDEAPILSGIARRVTNIDGNTKVPKSILKKAVRNVGDDKNEAGKTSNIYADFEEESDADEVYFPNEEYTSGVGGGLSLEEDDLDCYDGY